MIADDINKIISSMIPLIPPPGPPCRQYRDTVFFGLVETKKSKQAQHDYEMYMGGYMTGIYHFNTLIRRIRKKGRK